MIGWLLAGILSITFLIYLVAVVVNWNDAPPSAAVKHFTELRAQRPAVADEQNGYVYMVGMLADADADPLQSGKVIVERERARLSTQASAKADNPAYPQGNAVKVSSKAVLDLFDACREKDAACLQFLASDKANSIEFGSAEQLLLTRYQTLTTFPQWRENDFSVDGPIVAYTPALDGQKLALFDYWQHAARYGVKDISTKLEADARFWREVFDSADTLITRMVATAALQNNLFWSNLIMSRLAGSDSSFDMPATWQRPLSDEERVMERVWAGELAFNKSVISSVNAKGMSAMEFAVDERTFTQGLADRIFLPLFQPKATLNDIADTFINLMRNFRVPYEQLPLVAEKMKKDQEGFGGEGLSFPRIFYNPIGKVLNEIYKSNNSDYMLKVADLEGARRALLAAAALRGAHTSRKEAAEALAQLPLHNPYTNQPFGWDEATGSVLFEGLSDRHNRYLFPL